MEKMDEGSRIYQVPEMNLAAGRGTEIIIRKIGSALLGEKLLLRNDSCLNEEWYQKILVNHLEFFSPEEEVADIVEILESLFTPEFEETQKESEEGISETEREPEEPEE